MRTDGQVDKRDEANSRFSQFGTPLKSELFCFEPVSVIILCGRCT